MSKMPKIAVCFYSMYGHTAKMAEAIAAGARKVSGATVDLYRVEETLPNDVLEKMHAPPKSSHPVLTPTKLEEYDGFLMGIPTRYGVWPAQWKTFWDSTGQIWAKGGYHGKMAGVFVSTSSQHGGIETTALTALTTLVHHGIIFVPFGYAKAFSDLCTVSEVMGASAYGAGTCTSPDGSRQPSELELKLATIQGEAFAETLAKYTK